MDFHDRSMRPQRLSRLRPRLRDFRLEPACTQRWRSLRIASRCAPTVTRIVTRLRRLEFIRRPSIAPTVHSCGANTRIQARHQESVHRHLRLLSLWRVSDTRCRASSSGISSRDHADCRGHQVGRTLVPHPARRTSPRPSHQRLAPVPRNVTRLALSATRAAADGFDTHYQTEHSAPRWRTRQLVYCLPPSTSRCQPASSLAVCGGGSRLWSSPCERASIARVGDDTQSARQHYTNAVQL